jgi:hypothetical protein
LYSGDVTKDISESADVLDLAAIGYYASLFGFGYLSEDINGDGNIDILDSLILENNVNSFIFSTHP